MSYPVSHGSATSLRNPCPSGTSLGTGDLNGTIILICDAAFNDASSSTPINVELALGLGLGLGLPFLFFVFYLFYKACREEMGAERRVRDQALQIQHREPPPPPQLGQILTEGAYLDFTMDNLSDRLKSELMVHRVREGRNLDDVVREAQRRNAFAVATWVDHLNPGDIPLELRAEATKRPAQEV
jgi:hypothetical protein